MSKAKIRLMILTGFIVIFSINLITLIGYAETPIHIISANATSSSVDSLPVTYLLDTNKEGFWKPKTVDSGTNEGLFFQFQKPTLIDRIEIKVKGGAENFNINYYLDGKRNVSKNEPKQDNTDNPFDSLAYAIVQQDSGNDRLFSLGAGDYRFRSSDITTLQPLHVKITSIFIKITSASPKAAIVSIRFFQTGNEEPLNVKVPVEIKGKIKASSTLTPQTAYRVQNLFDSRVDFAWSTDGSHTKGIGEQIAINLDAPQDLSGIMIWNGYQRSDTHYYANARPSVIKISINDAAPFLLKLKDQMGSQMLSFPAIAKNAQKIRLTFGDVYQGTKYQDMVISELLLVDPSGNSIMLDAPAPPTDINQTKLQGMVDITLAPYMLGILTQNAENMERISVPFEAAWDYPYKTIRFRSNGSFVCYSQDDQIMEGNWEPIPDGIRIFGKRYRAPSVYNSSYLQEVEEKTAVKIFQANITVIHCADTSYEQVKKYFKSILADRNFYKEFNGKNPSATWWIGLKPYGKVKITANNEDQLLKKLFEFAAAHKAVLLRSSLFTDLFLPSDDVQGAFFYYP